MSLADHHLIYTNFSGQVVSKLLAHTASWVGKHGNIPDNTLHEDKKRNHAWAARPANQITLSGNPDDIAEYITLPNATQMDTPPVKLLT